MLSARRKSSSALLPAPLARTIPAYPLMIEPAELRKTPLRKARNDRAGLHFRSAQLHRIPPRRALQTWECSSSLRCAIVKRCPACAAGAPARGTLPGKTDCRFHAARRRAPCVPSKPIAPNLLRNRNKELRDFPRVFAAGFSRLENPAISIAEPSKEAARLRAETTYAPVPADS